MNQFFDAGRWWLLVGRHWSENKKKYTLSLIAMAGLLLLWFVFMLITESRHSMETSTQVATYYFGLFLVGCLFGSVIFADLGSKNKGLNFLVIPASHAEKLLCALFYSVLMFFVCYTALFYITDLIMLKLSNAVVYSHWLKEHTPGGEFEPQKLANVFYEYKSGSKPNYLGYLLLFYVALQSAFIAGSIYFSSFSFIKTIISLLVIGLFTAFVFDKLVMRMLPPGTYMNSLTGYHIYTVKDAPEVNGITISSNVTTDKVVSLPRWIDVLLTFLLQYAFAPLFWLVAYFRLKEKEI